MNRTKLFYIVLRVLTAIVMILTMFMGSGLALFGMGIMNLTLTILSFDELFVTSPFNQTSIAILKQNLQPVVWSGMLFFVAGVLMIVIGAFGLIYAIFEWKPKESNNAK